MSAMALGGHLYIRADLLLGFGHVDISLSLKALKHFPLSTLSLISLHSSSSISQFGFPDKCDQFLNFRQCF
jgi:hypothetical protein